MPNNPIDEDGQVTECQPPKDPDPSSPPPPQGSEPPPQKLSHNNLVEHKRCSANSKDWLQSQIQAKGHYPCVSYAIAVRY
ncbi:hypothetical protein Pan54_36280 [Rubinisphaera italica]|uniref:Uncharacterized protein n=1 Tax=Rubinisphaera italica TaxID=2527969 RepID=A0A5C5XMB8_9PLAN|nr:hypothetical protein Pan54_36280 [Rubinisphaera italica]